jgi:hypothetical protein
MSRWARAAFSMRACRGRACSAYHILLDVVGIEVTARDLDRGGGNERGQERRRAKQISVREGGQRSS